MLKHTNHEDHAAAYEVRNSRGLVVGARGMLAVPSAHAMCLAVYRKLSKEIPTPLFFMERRDARTGLWLKAERRLQKLTYEQMLNTARTSNGWLRMRVKNAIGATHTVRHDGSINVRS